MAGRRTIGMRNGGPAWIVLLMLGLSSVALHAQPADTVRVRQCCLNQLQLDGIDPVPEIWYVVPQEVTDSLLERRVRMFQDTLQMIGQIIGPKSIPDFDQMVLSITVSTGVDSPKSLLKMLRMMIALRVGVDENDLADTLMKDVYRLQLIIRNRRRESDFTEMIVIPAHSADKGREQDRLYGVAVSGEDPNWYTPVSPEPSVASEGIQWVADHLSSLFRHPIRIVVMDEMQGDAGNTEWILSNNEDAAWLRDWLASNHLAGKTLFRLSRTLGDVFPQHLKDAIWNRNDFYIVADRGTIIAVAELYGDESERGHRIFHGKELEEMLDRISEEDRRAITAAVQYETCEVTEIRFPLR